MNVHATERMRKMLFAASIYPFWLVSRHSFLRRMGWFRSIRTATPVDNKGQAIPWWSYSFILFLQERLNGSMRIFEYGSGYSTLWFAPRVGNVVTIETDNLWYQKLKNILPSNVELHYIEYEPDGKYCRIVQVYDHEFDIVIIDGRDRVRCAKNSVDALNTSGVIIFDDAHQAHLKEARDYLKDKGYRSIDFYGTGPLHGGMHCTSVFYRDHNCMGI